MFNLKFNIFKQPITKNGIDTFLHQPPRSLELQRYSNKRRPLGWNL